MILERIRKVPSRVSGGAKALTDDSIYVVKRSNSSIVFFRVTFL